MEKTVKKTISVLLSLLMALSVFGSTTFTAGATEKTIAEGVIYKLGDTIVLPGSGVYYVKVGRYSTSTVSGNGTITLFEGDEDYYELEIEDWYINTRLETFDYWEEMQQGLSVLGIKFTGSGTQSDPYLLKLAFGEVESTWAGEGEGTESAPWLINDVNDLLALSANVQSGMTYSGKYLKLTADIDCSGTDAVPIGGDKTFAGTFDGDGNTITYSIISSENDAPKGLFAEIGSAGTVKNLNVAGSIVNTASYAGPAGGIAANNSGLIENCYSAVDITKGCDRGTGGIAARNDEGATIRYCAASGTLTWTGASGSYAYIGGITGEAYRSTVTNSTSLCNVLAENAQNSYNYAGIFIGRAYNNDVLPECYYLSTAATAGEVNSGSATPKTADELKAIGQAAYDTGYTVYGLALGAVASNPDQEAAVASVTAGGTTTEYTDFATAVTNWNSAANGATLTLLADVTTESTIEVSGTKILDLNGYELKKTGSGGVINVNGANLTLNDSNPDTVHGYTISNPNNGAGLATVHSEKQDGDTEFTGGYITGGIATSDGGGGVRIASGGRFTMNGGTIIGNTSSGGYGGGGIFVINNNSGFTMNDGAIIGNTTTNGWGGGVNMTSNDGSFTMTGGVIEKNLSTKSSYADAHGGGVHAQGTGSFKMTGGVIRDNVAAYYGGNVSVCCNTFELSGSVEISGGKLSDGTDNNVYLQSNQNKKITVTGELSNSTPIGVNMDNPGVFTNSPNTNYNDPAKFFSDNDSYECKLANGQLRLLALPYSTVTLLPGEAGGSSMIDYAEGGTNYTLPSTVSFTAPAGKIFSGWSDGDNTYSPGEVVDTSTAGTEFTAQWVDGVMIPKTGTDTLDLSEKTSGYSITIFDNGGLTNNYENYSDGTLSVILPEGKALLISGTINIENGYDYLYVYGGTTENQLIKTTGENKTITISSADNPVILRFTSDSSQTKSGFVLNAVICDVYSATFYANNGAEESSNTDVPATFMLPDNTFTVPENKIFVGWKWAEDNQVYPAGSFITLTGESEFYAQWMDAVSTGYTLNDSYGDGWNGANLIVREQGSTTPTATLTLESGYSSSESLNLPYGKIYELVWMKGSYDSECSFTFTNPYDSDDVFTADSNDCKGYQDNQVLATFYPPEFTVTWMLDENTIIDTTTVYYGVEPTHADPTKDEDTFNTYTFAGWTSSGGTFYAKGTALPAVSGNETYTAVFTATPKAVPAKLTINVGENGQVVANNGTFGNATDASNIVDITAPINVTDGSKVFIVDDHTANLVEGGSINIATGGEVSFYPSADNTGVITAIPDEGYVFVGWYNGNTLYSSGAALAYQNISEDITLTAKFAPVPAGETIELNYDSDNAEITWGDLTDTDGLWQIQAYDPDTYLVLISSLSSEQAAGTYAWEDLDPDWTFVIDYADNNKKIHFTDGSCTVTVDGDTVTVEGAFTGDDGNTYDVTVTYTPAPAFDDGVGERLAGYTLSLDGDIGVNFYMELAPAIAQSETAVMHFTIPNGNKTNEIDVPVSEATVSGKYHIFKCNVAAKEMTSVIKAQIIDGETTGTEYTYSVKEYADHLLTNADANGTELQQAYAAAAPLVIAMLNYGAYAQKYFAPDTADENLANVGHAVDISGVTAQSITSHTYTNNLPGTVTFAGATLSLKTQTTLSLYFTADTELTFNCDHAYEVVENNGYQIIRIRNIHAKDLTEDFTVTVNDGESTGTITYCPMTYCYNVLNQDTTDDNRSLQNVCKALVLYADAADDYFPD